MVAPPFIFEKFIEVRKLEISKFVQNSAVQTLGEGIEYKMEKTSSEISPERERESYGIGVYRGNSRLHAIKDITIDKERLKALIDLCNREKLSFCHLYEVVDDFLGNLYGESF